MAVSQADIDISVVLVNYKTPDLTDACMDSIYSHTGGLHIEVIVVDNDSQDVSEEFITKKYPQALWLNMGYNSGFARANNWGIKHAMGKYILVLNSDTIANADTFTKSLEHYKELEQKHRVGFLGCKLIHTEGLDQFNSRITVNNLRKLAQANPIVIFFNKIFGIKPSKKMSRDELAQLHETSHKTAWLGGTFLLYNADISLKEGHYFDEDFFMYGEDMEWCVRLNRHQYTHFYYPGASVIHAEGGSFKIKENKWLQISLSEWLLIMKVYGKFVFFFVALFNLLGLFLDNILYRMSRKRSTNPDAEILFDLRKKTISMYLKNFWKIIFYYSCKPSSAKDFLKHQVIK